MAARPPREKERRALSHVGGEARREGDPQAAALLAAAVAVPPSAEAEELARAHVHGFHTYPARMHPLTARRLVDAFSQPGDVVLDPFCGSGTVLVEARLAGRAAVGVDANPLAVRLSRLKVEPATVARRERLVEAATRIAMFADERRQAKAGPTHRYPPADVSMFQPHVLLELDSVRAGLDKVADVWTREALELVLSAILIKLSRRESDTSEREVEKRLAGGYPARLFVHKTEELAARLAEVAPTLAAGQEKELRALVLEGDARELDGVGTASIALTVTSPPYPGNYDYLEHHAARLRWLRLAPGSFDRDEIGARRRLDPLGQREGTARWREELAASLRALRRVSTDDGAAVLLLADSVVASAPVYAVDLLRSVASASGFAVRAVASQPRPHFHADSARAFARRPRGEHAILLTAKPRDPRSAGRARENPEEIRAPRRPPR